MPDFSLERACRKSPVAGIDEAGRGPLAGPVVAGEPDVLAELAYQREQEMACRPEDFLLRRTRLGLFRPGLLSRPPALLAGGG